MNVYMRCLSGAVIKTSTHGMSAAQIANIQSGVPVNHNGAWYCKDVRLLRPPYYEFCC